ncbi:hypothetical protein [Hyphococcus sp.]|uniref:hypothetical protein n=1 Tax=Hyphococcus sp. TaxID=2038636 RepID=UPI003CCC373A
MLTPAANKLMGDNTANSNKIGPKANSSQFRPSDHAEIPRPATKIIAAQTVNKVRQRVAAARISATCSITVVVIIVRKGVRCWSRQLFYQFRIL